MTPPTTDLPYRVPAFRRFSDLPRTRFRNLRPRQTTPGGPPTLPDSTPRGRPFSRTHSRRKHPFRKSYPVPHPSYPPPPPLFPATNHDVGHEFGAKPAGSFRIWDGNLNGLSARDNFTSLNNLCATLHSKQVDAIAIQEPNLDFLQAPIREAILKICKTHFEHARVVTSTTCIKAPSSWKPGGSLLLIVRKWAHAVARSTTDDLGRWTTVTLNRQDSTAVTIYSAYSNVVNASVKAVGPGTVFAQQWQLLRLSGVQSPNPRKPFIADL
jgi:hypothetical protein